MFILKINGKIYDSNNKLKVLISQQYPNVAKCGYEQLSKKYPIEFVFESFIQLEGISQTEYQRQKIDISSFNRLIFTSKFALSYYFEKLQRQKLKANPQNKYFCLREEISNFLRKFIAYKKRKVFLSEGGMTQQLIEVISSQNSANDNFLYIVSQGQEDKQLIKGLKSYNIKYSVCYLYRTVYKNLKSILKNKKFDIVCYTTPSSILSYWQNFPAEKKSKTTIGIFGDNTLFAAKKHKLRVSFSAPNKKYKNLCLSLEDFLNKNIIKES